MAVRCVILWFIDESILYIVGYPADIPLFVDALPPDAEFAGPIFDPGTT